MQNNRPQALRRNNYFVKKSFQSRFSARFVLLIALEAVLIAVLLFYAASGTLTTGYQGSELTIQPTSSFFFVALLIISVIAVVAMGLAGMAVFVVFSHRIAGPVFRLQKTLRDIAAGDLTPRVRFREKDMLTDLADDLNQTVEGLDRRLARLKSGIEEASQLASKPEDLAKCKETLGRLKETAGSFKTTS